MNRPMSPSGVHTPASAYSHAIEVPANARWLVISGQVGISPDGKIADGIEAQLEQIYLNIETILKSAGMGVPRSREADRVLDQARGSGRRTPDSRQAHGRS
jgi:enamine deaminase RidA (YjgF/YER057c/UK114 family)